MIMVGAADSSGDETELACSLIRHFAPRAPVVSVRATAIHGRAGGPSHGGEDCRDPSSPAGDFEIITSTGARGRRDMTRQLRAGASRALRLRYLHDAMAPAATALLESIAPEELVVCESTSLRGLIEPDLFLMVRRASAPGFEPSAAEVRRFAERVIPIAANRAQFDLDDLQLDDGRWKLRERTPLLASAAILAGGRSSRMGEDKSLLPIAGKPMIQHLCELLSEICDEVMIGANDPERFAFLRVPVIRDREPDQGPLMAIASALDRARHELCFVVACDLPALEAAGVRRLVREASGFDAAVPMTSAGFLEPLHAVYRKTFLQAANAVLAAGGRKVSDGIERAHVNYVRDFSESELHNLNTRSDYEAYLRANARDR